MVVGLSPFLLLFLASILFCLPLMSIHYPFGGLDDDEVGYLLLSPWMLLVFHPNWDQCGFRLFLDDHCDVICEKKCGCCYEVKHGSIPSWIFFS